MAKRVLFYFIIASLTAVLFCAPAFAVQKNVKIAVLPFSIYSAEDLTDYETDVADVLLSALAYHEEIVPIDTAKVVDAVGDVRPEEMDEDFARSIGRKVGARYVVLGSMTKVGETISLDARLIEVSSKAEPERFYIETYGISTVLDRVGDLAKSINEKIFADQIIVKVTIRGNNRLSDEDIIGTVQSREGTLPYERFLAEDVKAITQMGYFESVEVETFPVTGGTEVVFTVAERELVREVRVTGAKKVDAEDIFEAISIAPPEVLSTRELKESIEAIKDLYAEKQYHAAEVDYTIENITEDEILLDFTIVEGRKMMVKKVEFIGNKKLSDRKLMAGLGNKEKGWIWWFTDRGKYNKDEIDNDVDRVTAVYYDNGYLEATVEPADVEMRENGIFITYRVSEGEKYKVSDVDISGDLIVAKEDLMKNLEVRPNRTFSREELVLDLEYLTREYENEGYALVDIQPQTDLDTTNYTVALNYFIVKGKKTYFERINISGNTKTLDKVIRRELRFSEGDLFNGDDLQRSQERVQNLGYFEEVNFATERGSADDRVVVNVDVVEQPTGLISAGLGYSSIVEVTGMVRLQERNLFGRGYKVSIAAEFSKVSAYYNIALEDPYFLDTNLAVSLRAYNNAREYDTYDMETMGFEFGVGYPIADDFRVFVNYIYYDANITDIDANADEDVWDVAGHNVTSGVEAIIVRDTRNNIYNPSKGSMNSLSVFVAGIGGDEKYYKMVFESSWYFPVVWELVFHPRLLVGYMDELGDDDIPIYARFFAGGLNSLRGFEPYSVGPMDATTGEYLGGYSELIVNLEMIFPLVEEANINGVVFFDMGNVWGEGDDYDIDDLRYSVGAGIRWLSPMGPIRIEWGYNLDPNPGEDDYEWNFSVGTSF